MPYAVTMGVFSLVGKRKTQFLQILERFLLLSWQFRSSPMINTIASRRFSALYVSVAVLVAAILGSSVIAPAVHSQAPATTTSNVALNALLTKLKTQQDQMAVNQTKIETQTAQLAETLRQAKIYSARSGSGHR